MGQIAWIFKLCEPIWLTLPHRKGVMVLFASPQAAITAILCIASFK